jgi:broad specificity phosphatase PhoE/MFS family permease
MVALVCLGVQFLYLCSYSVVLPISSRLTKHIWQEGDEAADGLTIKFFSGVLIGVQHVAFGVAIYLARYKFLHKERCIITVSMIISMVGSIMFAVGATLDADKEFAFAIILVARMVQGAGAGVDYTAKFVITTLSSNDMLTVYNSYWSIACAVGTGFGPILVFLTSVLPGADGRDVGMQSALPMLLLCGLELALFVLHVMKFPEAVTNAKKTAANTREVIPMSRADRTWKVATTVFLGFVRHLVRSAWEAIVSLALEEAFELHLSSSSLLLSMFYFTSVPAQTTFSRHRKKLSDNNWMHLMCWVAAAGVVLLWLGIWLWINGLLPKMVGLCIFLFGSLLIYDGLSVHATVSDVAGVKFADASDSLLNPANVILAQILAKGFIGRSVGPVVGRLSVHGGWHGFALLTLGLLLISELLTTFILEKEAAPPASARETELAPRNSRGQALLAQDEPFSPSSPSSPDSAGLPAETIEVKRRSVELVRRSQLSITSVETLSTSSWERFRTSETCADFARLKHGDSEKLGQASHALTMTIANHPQVGLWLATAPQDVCIIAPAYRMVPTAGAFMAIEIHKELCAMGGGKPVKMFQMKRRSITNGDFATMDMKTRRSSLANQFYLDDSEVTQVEGKYCLVIDDAIMYGTHVQVAIHTLEAYGVDKKAIISFCYIAATPDLLLSNPTVEHDLNVAFEPTLEALQGIFGQAQLTLTLRLVKLLLNLPAETQGALIDWMADARPDVLKVICKAIKDEGLKETERLNSRTGPSQAKTSSTQKVVEQSPGSLAPVVLVRHGQSAANVAKESNIYEYLYRKFADPSLVDAGLTPQGENDARRVGAELFGDGGVALSDVGLVVLSPLTRALQTASLALQAAGGALPEQCRVVAHPSAAERFFEPDIAENRLATEVLPGKVAEVGGREVDFSLCREWATKARFAARPRQPRRTTEAETADSAAALRDFVSSSAPAGTVTLVFCHWGTIKALSGQEVSPGAALRTEDWLDWRPAVAKR